MIEIAYTPAGTPLKYAQTNRNYIKAKDWFEAEPMVRKLIINGDYDIFIDRLDGNYDLIDYKSFNTKI